MINLQRLVYSPRFSQPFMVTRTSGTFGLGGFRITGTEQLSLQGIIQPSSDEDLAQVPEGDRVTGMMSFITDVQLYKTRVEQGSNPAGLGDTITWNGQVYKIVLTVPWRDFGFWKAVGSRQSGA